MNLPYFKWYPKDADGNERVRLMNTEEYGLYAKCLNHSWLNKGLPTDPKEIALAFKIPVAKFMRLWVRVSPCFEQVENRLVNRRQEEERAKAIAKSKSSTDAVRTRYERSSDVLPRVLAPAGSASGSGSFEGKGERGKPTKPWNGEDFHSSFSEIWKGFSGIEAGADTAVMACVDSPQPSNMADLLLRRAREWSDNYRNRNLSRNVNGWMIDRESMHAAPTVGVNVGGEDPAVAELKKQGLFR